MIELRCPPGVPRLAGQGSAERGVRGARARVRPKSRFIRQRVRKAGLLSQRDLD